MGLSVWTDAGMVTSVRLLRENAWFPMLVTESGMVIEVRLFTEKARLAILVTEFGIVTAVSCLLSNAPFPIVFTITPPIVLGILRARGQAGLVVLLLSLL